MSPLAALELPGWLAWAIPAAAFIALGIPFLRTVLQQRAYEAEYRTPTGPLHIAVTVRGPNGAPVDLARFATCWNQAFDCLAKNGPWPRALLVARLNPGNRVQIMPEAKWLGAGPGAGFVGGELVAGVLRVGPNLDVLAHELCHRAEAVLEGGATDNAHVTWQGRGLRVADESYRAWLARRG